MEKEPEDSMGKKRKRKKSATPSHDHVNNPSGELKKWKQSGDRGEEELGVGVETSTGPTWSVWSNLDLIISLQNRDVELTKKIELAFNYVELRAQRIDEDDEEEFQQTVKPSRVVGFLSEWVQLLLVSDYGKINADLKTEACFDCRCWKVLKFCLEDSLRLKISLNISRNLLKPIGLVAKSTFLSIKEGSFRHVHVVELLRLAVECSALVFLSHNGVLGGNLELWISAVGFILDVTNVILVQGFDGGEMRALGLRFAYLMLEPFAKFLRVHPARKDGFRKFVDKLLEPLLFAANVLGSQANEQALLTIVEEVLLQGLFHPAHVGGFLNLCSMERVNSSDISGEDFKVEVRSYHRHFFVKVNYLISLKNNDAQLGLGNLLHLLCKRVRSQRQKEILHMLEGSKAVDRIVSREHNILDNFTTENRIALFKFFVHVIVPLLKQLENLLVRDLELDSCFLEVHTSMKAVHFLLSTLLGEKIYHKTDDNTENFCLTFLEKAYNTIFSVGLRLLPLHASNLDKKTQEILNSLGKDVFLLIQHFLSINYEVAQNNIDNIWILILKYVNISSSVSQERCPLFSQILAVSCQLMKVYSDLRQVKIPVLGLCKAIRNLCDSDEGNVNITNFKGVLRSERDSVWHGKYSRSIETLLSKNEFILALHNGIKSLPEGQVGEFIKLIAEDSLVSIEWLKFDECTTDRKEFEEANLAEKLFKLFARAELLGRGLCGIYATALDSVTINVGNCVSVSHVIKDFIIKLRPYIILLVAAKSNGINEFLELVLGEEFGRLISEEKCDELASKTSSQWIFVYFFRLYVSIRSLYRQTIGLLPPGTSKKMAVAMGDLLSVYDGSDWVEQIDPKKNDYFSLIVQPSCSLLEIILITKSFVKVDIRNCCALFHLFLVMIMQRLADLNKQLNSSDYVLQAATVQINTCDDADLTSNKRRRKWRNHILTLNREANELTDFLIYLLSSVKAHHLSESTVDFDSYFDECEPSLLECGMWFRSIGCRSEKSLSVAAWQILCQSIDLWSGHASKKDLSEFLEHLIVTSLPFIIKGMTAKGNSVTKDDVQSKNNLRDKIGMISSAVLDDVGFLEHKFVSRNLASTFCNLLDKFAPRSSYDSTFGHIMLSSSPCWLDVITILENPASGVLCQKPTGQEVLNGISRSLPFGAGLNSSDILACQSLLNLLCRIPKGCISSRSFSQYATCLLNFERFIAGCLTKYHDILPLPDFQELLTLLVTCRRAMKGILSSYCEWKSKKSKFTPIPVLFEDPYSSLWLLKSTNVAIECHGLSGDVETRDSIFSLIDHTSHIFLILSKFLMKNRVKEMDERILKWISLVVDALREQVQNLADMTLICKEPLGLGENTTTWNLCSVALSCYGGLLRGLTNAWEDTFKIKEEIIKWKGKPFRHIDDIICMITRFSACFLPYLCSRQEHVAHDNGQLRQENFLLSFFSEASNLDERRYRKHGEIHFLSLLYSCKKSVFHEQKSFSDDTNSVASFHADIELFQDAFRGDTMFVSLLEGCFPEVAFLLGQLLTTSVAIFRLKRTKSRVSQSHPSAPLIYMSVFLISKFSDMTDASPSSLVWLDGALKYLLELAIHVSSSNLSQANSLYRKLVEVILKALGKCISSQGKHAVLESHHIKLNEEIVDIKGGSSASSCSYWNYCLGEFKGKLRLSLIHLVRQASEMHLLTAIQVLGRAIVGVHKQYTVVSEVIMGSIEGRVSPTVAASIDFLDLILEHVSGRKQLKLVKEHIHDLVAALLSIIIHLRSPFVFCCKLKTTTNLFGPDPGAVIIMSVEVLTRISSKRALLQLDPCHAAEFLRLPTTLIQGFQHLRDSDNLFLSNGLLSPDYEALDHPFFIRMYAACCRLLYTTVKYYRLETDKCIGLLQESSRNLLLCLAADIDKTKDKCYFSMSVEEILECAGLFRRIYEELREQKDVLGRHCFKFISDYLWVYSGCGRLKAGIIREVDEALRPGLYALLDASPADDLQYLHSVLGEGHCRNTLATLQHDYQQHFRYEGKV